LSFVGGAECARNVALSRLLEEHRAPVVRFLYRLVGDQGLAEELTQQVFVRAYGSLQAPSATWLFRTAMQLARPHGRCTAEGREANSLVMLLRRALAALPLSHRAAVLLHKYQRFDYNQIGAVLGCSDSAVRTLLLQAYGTLWATMPNTREELAAHR